MWKHQEGCSWQSTSELLTSVYFHHCCSMLHYTSTPIHSSVSYVANVRITFHKEDVWYDVRNLLFSSSEIESWMFNKKERKKSASVVLIFQPAFNANQLVWRIPADSYSSAAAQLIYSRFQRANNDSRVSSRVCFSHILQVNRTSAAVFFCSYWS